MSDTIVHDPGSMPLELDACAPSGEYGWTRGRALSVAIVAVATGLMAIGAIMTVSAAAPREGAVFGWPLWDYPAMRQLIFLFGALLAMLVMTCVPYQLWSKACGTPTLLLLVIAIVMSLLVLVPGIGTEVNNARRWIQIGPAHYGLRIQPSELFKLALPAFLALWMARGIDIRRFFSGFLPAVAVIGIAVAVVGIEDFGTAALLAAVGGAMLLMGGARIWHLLLLVLPTVPAFGYLLFSRAHRMERLISFRDIWADPEGTGYQAIQSLCTIARGGWWGVGLGNGLIKDYLPAARTDFIFSVLCEELGIVGGLAVIGLLIVLLYNGGAAMRRCPDAMGQLLAFGIVLMIGLQAFINIAVVTVSVPTKGIALPLVSAGGSGAVVIGAMAGILANIARRAPDTPGNP